MKIEKVLKRYRLEDGKHFRLKDHDPGDTHGLKSGNKSEAQELLSKGVQELARLQDSCRTGPMGGVAHLAGHGRGR